MVADSVLRIPVEDLQTIRVSIKGIAVELPLDVDVARDFLAQQQRGRKIGDAAYGIVLALIDDLKNAQAQVSDDFRIEFVISDPEGKSICGAGKKPTNG